MSEGFALDALARISGYFVLSGGGPADPAAGWRPVPSLLDRDDPEARLDAAIDDVHARLGGGQRWVAASVFFQGWAARLTSIYAGSIALGAAVPDLAAERLAYRFVRDAPVQLLAVQLHALAPDEAWRRLHEDHLALLAEAIRSRVRISRRILEGNLASSLAGSLKTLEFTGRARVGDLIEDPRLTPADIEACGQWIAAGSDMLGAQFLRSSCCGIRLVDGYGRCGDCSLERPGRPARHS